MCSYLIGDHLIIPARYLDELRQLPDDKIDVLKSFQDVRSPLMSNEQIT